MLSTKKRETKNKTLLTKLKWFLSSFCYNPWWSCLLYTYSPFNCVSPHPSLPDWRFTSWCQSARDPHVNVTSSRVTLDFHLPLTFLSYTSQSQAPSLFVLTFYLIFTVANSCPLALSCLVNTTCRSVPFHPPSPNNIW